MKIILSFFIVSFFSHFLMAQSIEKIITIKDDRNLGIYKWDTVAIGKKPGELYVSKIKWISGETSFHPDTITATSFQVYKMVKNELVKYETIMEGEFNIPQIAYNWVNDTLISFTYIDPKLNFRGAKPTQLIIEPTGSLHFGNAQVIPPGTDH